MILTGAGAGAGVGGGSLVYANVLYEPSGYDPSLAPFYERARRMLGATIVPFETPADEVMKVTIAAQAERAMSFWPDRGEADLRPPVARR